MSWEQTCRALTVRSCLPRRCLLRYAHGSLRAALQMLQCYAMADLGLVVYESCALDGMIADEAVLIELVRPGTGDPVPTGEVGEVVVTTLLPEYPLIRFATGDLSAELPGASPCGRTNMRIKGWFGTRRPDRESERHVREAVAARRGRETSP